MIGNKNPTKIAKILIKIFVVDVRNLKTDKNETKFVQKKTIQSIAY